MTQNGTDTEALKRIIVSSGMSISFIARKLNITREGFYKKMNNETEFKASEISTLKDTLRLTNSQRDAIFFAKKVEQNSTL